jgi:hypothetical protein
MVTVVFAYPETSSTPLVVVADAHPHAPPATTNASKMNVLSDVPPTVTVLVACAAMSSLYALPLKAGLPLVIVAAMGKQ